VGVLLGPRAGDEPRDARAARAVQRRRRGGEAGRVHIEVRAGAWPLPDDALERRHGLPAADDHPRGARGGHRDPRRRPLGRRRVRRLTLAARATRTGRRRRRTPTLGGAYLPPPSRSTLPPGRATVSP